MNREQIEQELLKAKAQCYDAIAMRETAESRLERANTRVKELLQRFRALEAEVPSDALPVAEPPAGG